MSKKPKATKNSIPLPSNDIKAGRPIKSLKSKEALVLKYLDRAKRERREGVLKHLDFDESWKAWKAFDGLLELDKKSVVPALDAWVQEHMSSEARTRMLAALRKADFAKQNLRSIDLSVEVADRLSYEASHSGKTISEFLDGLLKKKNK